MSRCIACNKILTPTEISLYDGYCMVCYMAGEDDTASLKHKRTSYIDTIVNSLRPKQHTAPYEITSIVYLPEDSNGPDWWKSE